MGRVGDFGDVLICKVVRNISQWTFGEQRMITHATEHRELIKDQRRRIKRAERAARKGDTPEEDESGREDSENEDDEEGLPVVHSYQQRRLWGEHVGHILKMAMDCESQVRAAATPPVVC